MEATLTLHQAGNQLGVDDTVLSRLIRIGALPEARKVHRPDGVVWVIPTDALEAVATRNGWTIDLRTGASEPAEGDDISALVPRPDPTEPTVAGPIDDDGSETEGSAMTGSGIELTSADEEGDPFDLEAVDLAVLDRLLVVQEERVTAMVEARETKHALAALNASHDRATGELEIERRERMIAADRYREERMARAVADAKVAELRDRVVREMSLAEAEKQALSEALARSIRAEREAATALASMGWLARRRFHKVHGAEQ